MSINPQLAISVLQILIEEMRKAHHKRWNKGKQQKHFKVVNTVKYHIQVQSKEKTGELNKLSYLVQGPFQVKSVLVNYSYEVYWYNDLESAMRKYKSKDLYLPTQDIYPHVPVFFLDIEIIWVQLLFTEKSPIY